MFNRSKRTVAIVLTAVFCAFIMAGCGKVNATATAVTVNGETVSAGTASTFIRYQQAETITYQQYIYSMYGMEFDSSNYWNQDYGEDGQTYGESFVSAAKEDLVKMVLIRQHAPEYGYELTEDEKNVITEAAAKFISDNGTVANWIGADQASVENVLSLYNYQTKTKDLFIADVDRNVTDEEASQSTVIYASLSRTAPDDFEGTEEEYAAQAKELMDQMLTNAKAADVDKVLKEIAAEEAAAEKSDSEEDADLEEDAEETDEELAKDEETDEEILGEKEEEDLTLSKIVSNEVNAYKHVAGHISSDISVNSASYSTNDEEDTTLASEVLTAARALKDGEFCDSVIETDTAYYIVKMEALFDEDKTETKKDQIISDREDTAYNDLIQSWVDSAEIVYGKAFDKIKVTDRESYVVAGQ